MSHINKIGPPACCRPVSRSGVFAADAGIAKRFSTRARAAAGSKVSHFALTGTLSALPTCAQMAQVEPQPLSP